METIKRVVAPVRIDFAGGTTDIYPFTRIGGAVLNAAINKHLVGRLAASNKRVSLEYHGSIPTSSGLGTSGVMNLVWLALISKTRNRLELAERAYDLEKSIGIIGGRQDQYASALGGINFLEFKNEKVKVTRLNLAKKLINELENSLVLVYTGKPHLATSSNKLMISNLLKGKTKENLIRIRDIAAEMKGCLLKGDLEKFADLMNQETEERRKLHKSIIPPSMERIMKIGRENKAVSAKVCGAGGGGSILFFGDKKVLKRKFKGRIIDFRFDFQGLRWI